VAHFEFLLLGMRSLYLVFVALNGFCVRVVWDLIKIGVWLFVWFLFLAGLRLQSANMLVPHAVVQVGQ
jgi:hypothetical protein